jgi:erythromycin esterase
VALGECTHGSHEVFQLKHRLLTALVEQQHYTVFAIEADFTGAQCVNEYVQTGVGDSLKVLDALGYWTWYTQEVWELIKWMKTYNQLHPHALTFRGFDMNYPFLALRAVEQFAQQRADTATAHRVAELQTICRRSTRLPGPQQRRARQLSARLAATLRQQQAPADLLQSARTLVQYTQMRSAPPYFGNRQRDKYMARNVEWLAQQHPTEKLVLWAHNSHVERRGGLSKSMGHHLARTYGPRYLTVGFATGQGTYTAVKLDPTAKTRHLTRDNMLLAPVAGAVESWLAQARKPNFYLALRGLPRPDPASAWLQQKRHLRSIGSTVPAQPAYQFVPTHQLVKEYDVLVYLNFTSASQCLLVK